MCLNTQRQEPITHLPKNAEVDWFEHTKAITGIINFHMAVHNSSESRKLQTTRDRYESNSKRQPAASIYDNALMWEVQDNTSAECRYDSSSFHLFSCQQYIQNIHCLSVWCSQIVFFIKRLCRNQFVNVTLHRKNAELNMNALIFLKRETLTRIELHRYILWEQGRCMVLNRERLPHISHSPFALLIRVSAQHTCYTNT